MAASEKLTDKAVQAALKAASAGGNARALSDGGGLMLEVQTTGAGWWRLRYSFGGRENRLSLGRYPDVSLKEARQRRDDARKLIAAGIDPSEARRSEKAAAVARGEAKRLAAEGKPGRGTFEHVAREWLVTVHELKVSAAHAERTRIRFEQDVFPWLGARPIGEVEAPELLTCLRRVIARGAIETAHRTKDACAQVFRFGVASGYCERNPAADLRDALPPVPTRHLAAIVEPQRAADLLRAMLDYKGHPTTRSALTLSALLFLRPGELRQLEWKWIDFEEAMLMIPSTLMKRSKAEKANGAPHAVPLAAQPTLCRPPEP